jgi:flagellar hook-basal body complex protein FliE
MIDPISSNLSRITPAVDQAAKKAESAPAAGTDAFASALRKQLEEVSQMQSEAGASVQRLLTGETENMSEVFSAARKAEVAFSLLMQIRNKMVDAYSELRQIQV